MWGWCSARSRPEHVLVYGFWRPFGGGNPFGPFINRKHFAGWMVMALPMVFGYSLGLCGCPDVTSGMAKLASLGLDVDAHRVLVVGVAAV